MQIKGEVYFIGIKGTGMCALAELMHGMGISVSGSDVDEVFYTDGILKQLKIPYHEVFDASHIGSPSMIVYSDAYSFETNAEMAEARRRGIPLFKFADAVGEYSKGFDSSGIAGVHGKTTTTAIAGTLLKGAEIPAQVLAGSAVSAFGDRSTLNLGDRYFIAETCEYRRNFLSFHPKRIVLTGVETDHTDFFPTYEDIRDAFMDYCKLLPEHGELIYCHDDEGARDVALALKKERPDITLTPYGFEAPGDFRIDSYKVSDERIIMRIGLFPFDFSIRVPGKHTALNAAGAIALVSSLIKKEGGWDDKKAEGVKNALSDFKGSKRRSEILGEAGGILFMDDYAHHPTEIMTTLSGLRDFYPSRRLIVSFMSHTFSRTVSLFDEFASSFTKADIVILHSVYGSARELKNDTVNGLSLGKALYEKVRERGGEVFFVEEPDDSFNLLEGMLRPGDLFITMGAGSNWTLGKKLFNHYSS